MIFIFWIHSFATENKFKLHKKGCENKNFCYIAMSSEDTKILEFNQHQKFDHLPFVIYADRATFLEYTDFKEDLIDYICYIVTSTFNKSLMKS